MVSVRPVRISISVSGKKDVRVHDAENLAKRCIVAAVRKYLKGYSAHVDVTMVSGEEIQTINRENRNVDKVTDVLSFPMLDMYEGVYHGDLKDEIEPNTGDIMLGDIIICYDKISEQAEEFGHSKEREMAYLATHSILHLLGFDHVDEGEMKAKMRAAEEEIIMSVSKDLTR
ncbi:MAG: rRNA maturation RNase YbeY [Clostridia bacterium]|nr:rRNA maturation RNase YbeY [Clostridia bacterium]